MYTGKITNIQWERVFITIEGQLEYVDSEDKFYDLFRLRKPNWFDLDTGKPLEESFDMFYAQMKNLTENIIPDYKHTHLLLIDFLIHHF